MPGRDDLRLMDLKAGNYFRRKADRAIVKLLSTEVFPYECFCGALGHECQPEVGLVYRLNDDEYPHRYEYITVMAFLNNFEDGLVWDPKTKRFTS